MTITALNAAGVYGNIGRLANRGPGVQSETAAGSNPLADFGSLVKSQVEDLVQQGKVAEQKQADELKKKGPLPFENDPRSHYRGGN